MTRSFVAASAFLVVVAPAEARGESAEARARAHDDRARELFVAEDYEAALAELEAAQALLPATARVYNMARCADRLDRLGTAIVLYQRYVDAEDADEARRGAARERLAELRAELDDVSPEPEEPSPAEPPRREDPVDGAAPAASGRPTLGPTPFWAMLGLTGAATVATVVLGSVTLALHEDFEDRLSDEPDYKDRQQRGQAMALATDVLLGVAVASALATTVLGILTSWSRRRPTVSVIPGLGAEGLLGLSGRF